MIFIIKFFPLLLSLIAHPFKSPMPNEQYKTEIRIVNPRETALTLMKKEYYFSKKAGCPHSIWKLIQADNENDLIFEQTVPPGGIFKPLDCLTKITVQGNKASIYRIETSGFFSPEEKEKHIEYLSHLT